MMMSIGSNGLGAFTPATTTPAASKQKSGLDAALAAFEKEATKTPAEKIRDEVLKKHGLSEDQYDKLSGPQKDAIDKEVQEAVKQQLTQNKTPKESAKGQFVDSLA